VVENVGTRVSSCHRALVIPLRKPPHKSTTFHAIAVDGDCGSDLLTAGQVAAENVGNIAVPLVDVTGNEVGGHLDFENHVFSSKRADQLARGHAALDPAKARVGQMSCCARRPLFGELKAHSQNNADAR
jgi:hypothetical protein